MLQRIQSLCLAIIVIAMFIFLKFGIQLSQGIVRYGAEMVLYHRLSIIIALCIIVITVYTIKRHDNRRLQLRWLHGINLMLVMVGLWGYLVIRKTDKGDHNLSKLARYQLICPIIGLSVAFFARRHIKNDERLVHDDRLR